METNERLTMKALPETERPYEKLERFGPGALSDAELLAILLRTGTRRERALDVAARCLKEAGSICNLFSMTLSQLAGIPGIGRVKAIQLQAVMEISIRISHSRRISDLKAEDPASVAEAYMETMRHHQQEYLHALFLNNQNRLVYEKDISIGTADRAIVCARDIFSIALEHRAVRFILMHNHPGGDPTPSHSDIEVTKRLREAGTLMEIELLDHIIFGDGTYYSMREHNPSEAIF